MDWGEGVVIVRVTGVMQSDVGRSKTGNDTTSFDEMRAIFDPATPLQASPRGQSQGLEACLVINRYTLVHYTTLYTVRDTGSRRRHRTAAPPRIAFSCGGGKLRVTYNSAESKFKGRVSHHFSVLG